MNSGNISLTQRAYTLRLAPAAADDATWRDRLWRTHCAVNRGAAAFGDWLLTLRGGLDHRLAELQVKKRSGKRPPTPEERRNRRILLTLSWLTVEVGYTGPHAVPAGQVVDTLCDILRKRGLAETEIASWVSDCAASLGADIKDGATWVNRSAAFDEAIGKLGPSLNRNEIWDLLRPFFGSPEKYLKLAALKNSEDEEAGEETEDLVQKAGQWLSSRFGTGPGTNFSGLARVYKAMHQFVASLTGPESQDTFSTNWQRPWQSFPPGRPDSRPYSPSSAAPATKARPAIC